VASVGGENKRRGSLSQGHPSAFKKLYLLT